MVLCCTAYTDFTKPILLDHTSYKLGGDVGVTLASCTTVRNLGFIFSCPFYLHIKKIIKNCLLSSVQYCQNITEPP